MDILRSRRTVEFDFCNNLWSSVHSILALSLNIKWKYYALYYNKLQGLYTFEWHCLLCSVFVYVIQKKLCCNTLGVGGPTALFTLMNRVSFLFQRRELPSRSIATSTSSVPWSGLPWTLFLIRSQVILSFSAWRALCKLDATTTPLTLAARWNAVGRERHVIAEGC